jgi:predicted RNA-binding Zn-ribbon protein involved in translation (DUF1610 family)
MNRKKEKGWQELNEIAMQEISEWRAEHSKASFTEIEETLDRRMAEVRAHILKELLEDSPRADIRGEAKESRPACPECGTGLIANGQHTREITTTYEQRIELTRSYGRCPECGCGFFPPG